MLWLPAFSNYKPRPTRSGHPPSAGRALVDLPLTYQQTRNKALSRAVALVSFGVVLIGLGVLGITRRILH